MKKQRHLANAILWAAAIIGSAWVGAPSIIYQILLPALAVLSMPRQSPQRCFVRRAQT